MRPIKLCKHPGCLQPAEHLSGYCDRHQPPTDMSTPRPPLSGWMPEGGQRMNSGLTDIR